MQPEWTQTPTRVPGRRQAADTPAPARASASPIPAAFPALPAGWGSAPMSTQTAAPPTTDSDAATMKVGVQPAAASSEASGAVAATLPAAPSMPVVATITG